jgi:septum formation protein
MPAKSGIELLHSKQVAVMAALTPPWILASASPRRKAILSRLGLHFLVDPGRSPEPERRIGESPERYALRMARVKAKEVSERHRSGLIISADTIVVIKGQVLGKPANRAEARRMLRVLSGRWHEVLSGVCLLDCSQRRIRSALGRSRVHFRKLASNEIEWYLDSGEQQDKAGAYGIQGRAALFIDRIEGCYFNVVGFPIAAFLKLCHAWNIDLTKHLH